MPFTVNSMKFAATDKVVLACTKRSNRLDSTAFCCCAGKTLISCQDTVSTCLAVSCWFLCELQLICIVLCGTFSAEADNAGETKGVTDGNSCCPSCDEVEVVIADTGKEYCTEVTVVSTEDVVGIGIGETVVTVGGSKSWLTVAFAASDNDAFVVSGDVVVMGVSETNCWTEAVAGGLAETKAR